jgi:hypothetical protein
MGVVVGISRTFSFLAAFTNGSPPLLLSSLLWSRLTPFLISDACIRMTARTMFFHGRLSLPEPCLYHHCDLSYAALVPCSAPCDVGYLPAHLQINITAGDAMRAGKNDRVQA